MAKSSKGLTDAQQEAVQQFRKNVSDIISPHDTDAVLVKWLKGRNYDIKKAEVYFREAYAFRQMYQLDTLVDTFLKPEVIERYEYSAFLGFAKDGSTVRYTAVGKGDHYGLVMSMSTYMCSLYCTYLVEADMDLQRKENIRTGRDINEMTYIFDFDGVSLQDFMHKNVVEMTLDLSHAVQDYYPEVWGNLFAINVPPYFDAVFNFVKPILRLGVIQKLQVVAKESVAETLLKYIDEDVLPVFLGGKREDSSGDPYCKEFLRFGGKVPQQYYLCNQPLPSPTDPDVNSVWIYPRCSYNHCLVVRNPGSTMRIEFRTENGSIFSKILFRKVDNFEKAVIPTNDEYLNERDEKTNVVCVSPGMRLQSQFSHIDTTLKAPWQGIYIFRFENSHSWFGSRRLIYRIGLVESDSDFVIVP